jgi:hypothetical protein
MEAWMYIFGAGLVALGVGYIFLKASKYEDSPSSITLLSIQTSNRTSLSISPSSPVVTTPHIEMPQPVIIFPKQRADYRENQNRELRARTEQEILQINHAAQIHMSVTSMAHEEQILPAKLAEQDALRKTMHATAMAQNVAIQKLTEQATALGLDVTNYGVSKLEELRLQHDIKRAKELSQLKIAEAKALDENRIHIYAEEKQIDISGAVGLHLLDIEKLDFVLGKIARLKKDNADPAHIETFERICVQMERRLLAAPEQSENVEGIDEDSEGRPDH